MKETIISISILFIILCVIGYFLWSKSIILTLIYALSIIFGLLFSQYFIYPKLDKYFYKTNNITLTDEQIKRFKEIDKELKGMGINLNVTYNKNIKK